MLPTTQPLHPVIELSPREPRLFLNSAIFQVQKNQNIDQIIDKLGWKSNKEDGIGGDLCGEAWSKLTSTAFVSDVENISPFTLSWTVTREDVTRTPNQHTRRGSVS